MRKVLNSTHPMANKARRRIALEAQTPVPVDAIERLRTLLVACLHLLESDKKPVTAQKAVPVLDLSTFSARELEFLRLVSHPDCWPYSYIAARMGIKEPTLHYMRRKLFKKLAVKGRTALVLKLREMGLDSSPQ